MFLSKLNSEQKELFLELAMKAAEVNGIIELEEKNMLKCFAIEMNIAPIYGTDKRVEDIVNRIVDISSEKELRIILFEILGIIVSDSVFDESEQAFINWLFEKCNIEYALAEQMLVLLTDYLKVYQKIVEIVL